MLREAEETLGQKFPIRLFDFFQTLEKYELEFGEEEWLFPEDVNYIIERSRDVKKHWGIDTLVFADNGLGDFLLVHPDKLGDIILVLRHEEVEIKYFAKNIDTLLKNGPVDYQGNAHFFYKIHKDGRVVYNECHDPDSTEDDEKERAFRSKLDDWIDDGESKKISKILSGLESLTNSIDERNRIWAYNKLSDIYFKGFDPIPKNVEKALEYNQLGLNLESHVAYANRAACYFFGIGMEKDLDKALADATKANNLSKANTFSDILAESPGGGMHDRLLNMIRKEIGR